MTRYTGQAIASCALAVLGIAGAYAAPTWALLSVFIVALAILWLWGGEHGE